ncbi:MAG: hypothetical protein ACKVPX_09680 [Myxococcaceae bacterium]
MRVGSLSILLLWSVVGTAACGRIHTLEEGRYTFSAEEVLSDECAIATAPALFEANYRVAGDRAEFETDLFAIRLAGYFLVNTERFAVDGTAAGVETSLGGQPCLLDLVSVHVEASTRSSAAFTGAMDFRFQTPDIERCQCRSNVLFRATLQ